MLNDRVTIDYGNGIVISVERCNTFGCENAGTISQGIRGNGPWYCREHFVFSAPKSEPAQLIPREIEAQVAAEYPKEKQPPYLYWARRILRFNELGQPMPNRSIEIAREVLGIRAPQRGQVIDGEFRAHREPPLLDAAAD